MFYRSRDDPDAWLSHEPQYSMRTSHYTRYALHVKAFYFSGTLYANDLNIHVTVLLSKIKL